MPAIADLIIAIKADIDDFHKGMATARESMGILGATTQDLGRAMQRTGAIMTATGAAGAAAIGLLVNEANRLDKAYREVTTLMGQGADAQQEFGSAATRISEELAVQGGQLQVVQGLYQTLSASITDSAEATKFMETAAKTAAVGVTDMETTVDVMSTALNAYGMETKEAARVSDILFSTVRQGKVRFDELARSIGPVIAFAAQFNVKLEEVSAGMALLTRQGFSARRSAEALRSVIASMVKPSEDMKEVLISMAGEEIKVSENAMKAVRAYREKRDAVNTIQGKLDDYNSTISDNTIKINEITRLTKDEAAAIRDLESDIRSANSALRDMSGEMDGLSDSMRENRIKMMEIRLEARKQGRKLTDEEKKQLEELELSNEELRLEQLKLKDSMDEVEDARRDAKQSIEDIKGLTDEERKAVAKLRRENDLARDAITKLSKELGVEKDALANAEGELDGYAETFGQALLEQNGFVESLQMLKKAGAEANVPMEKIFNNQRALQAIYPLLTDGASDYNEILKAVKDSTGVVNEAHEDLFAESFSAGFQRMINALRNMMAELGKTMQSAVKPIVRDLYKMFQNLRKSIANLDPATKKAIGQFAVLAAGISLIVGPLLFISGLFVSMIGVLGMGGLAGVLGIAAAAFGALGIAFLDLKNGGDNVEQTLKAAKKAIGNLIEGAKNLWSTLKETLIPALLNLVQSISDVASEVATLVAKMTEGTGGFDKFKEAGKTALKVLSNGINTVANFISKNDELIAKVIVAVGKFALLTAALGKVIAIGAGVVGAISGVVGTLTTLGGAFAAASATSGPLIGAISTLGLKFPALATKLARIVGVFGKVGTAISGLVGGALSTFGSVLSSIGSQFVAAIIAPGATAAKAISVLKGKFLGAISAVTKFLGKFRFIGQVIRTVIGHIGTIVSSFTSFQGIVQLVRTALGYLVSPIRLVLSALAALNPVTVAIIALIAALSAGIYAFQNNIGNFRTTVINAFNAVKSSVESAMNFVVNELIKPLLTELQSVWNMHFKGMETQVQKTVTHVSGVIADLKKIFKDVMGVVADVIREGIMIGEKLWEKFGTDIIAIVEGLFDTIIPLLGGLLDGILSVIKAGMAVIRGDWGEAWDILAGYVDRVIRGVWNWLKTTGVSLLESAISLLIDAIKYPFEQLYNWLIGDSLIPDLFKDIADFIKNDALGLIQTAVNKLWNWIKNTFSSAATTVYNTFKDKTNEWISWVKQNYEKLKKKAEDIIKRMFKRIKDELSKFITKSKSKIKKWIGKVQDRFRELKKKAISQLKKLFKQALQKLKNWISNSVKKIKNFIKDVVNKFKTFKKDAKRIWKNLTENLYKKIKNWAKDVWLKIKKLVKDVVNKFKTFKKDAKRIWKNMVSSIWTKVKNWAKNIWNKFKTLVSDIIEKFKELARKLIGGSIIPNMLSDIISAVKNWTIKDAFEGALGGAYDAVKRITGNMITTVQNTLSKVSEIAGNIKSTLQSAQRNADKAESAAARAAAAERKAQEEAYEQQQEANATNTTPHEGDKPTGHTGGDNTTTTGTAAGETSGGTGHTTGDFDIDTSTGTVYNGDEFVQMSRGGILDAGMGTPAMLHGPEAVMPLPKLDELIKGAIGLGARTGTSGGGGGSIIVQEGAIKIEEGAFQGVAEEDLKDEVGSEVEGKLTDVLEEIKGAGR